MSATKSRGSAPTSLAHWPAIDFFRRGLRTLVRDARCAPIRRFNQRHAQDYDLRRTLIISGMRRGGSTWLAELLSAVPDTTPLWEPLDIADPRKAADLRFAVDARATPDADRWWIPYIPQSADWPEARRYFQRLLSGQILHAGMFQLTAEVPHRPTRHYSLKFCRANRLLPWLVANFPTRPPVFLVRHPCAVVASMLRHRPAARIKPPYVVVPDRYSEEFHQPYQQFLAGLETREEVLAAMWCLDHVGPLRHPWNDQRWITLPYERLVKSGVDEFRGLCRRLELDVPSRIEAELSRPSRTTVGGSPILEGGDQLSGWRKHLTPEQIGRVLAVVARFNLDDVYSEDLEPNYDRLAAPGAARVSAPQRDQRAA